LQLKAIERLEKLKAERIERLERDADQVLSTFRKEALRTPRLISKTLSTGATSTTFI
jgi:hypothetical protein